MTFYVRTSRRASDSSSGSIQRVVGAARSESAGRGPADAWSEQVRENVFLDRLISILSAAFAALATLLAAVGLYGVLAYTVVQRTREIGLRMALGATPQRVRAMVLGQVGVMTVVGGLVGMAAAVWLGRISESLLYQTRGMGSGGARRVRPGTDAGGPRSGLLPGAPRLTHRADARAQVHRLLPLDVAADAGPLFARDRTARQHGIERRAKVGASDRLPAARPAVVQLAAIHKPPA